MNFKSTPLAGAANRFIATLTYAYDFARTQWFSLFPFGRKQRPSALEWLALAALYGIGLFAWRYFLNGGDIPLELHDWAEVSAPRYAFLKSAVTNGDLPLHMPGFWALRNVTDRFITIADTNLSPQIILLRWFEVGEFVLANALILYTLGFGGLILLRRRFNLSIISFAILYGLLLFNGHITSHVAVGHANWLAFLLLPYLAYLILWLFDNPRRWPWISLFTLWMLVVAMNGAFHLYVTTLIFMLLLLISYRDQRGTILLGIGFSLGASAIRLLPPILEVTRFDTEFLSGYTTVAELIASFVWLREPTSSQALSRSLINPLGWWEKDFYFGAVGFIFMVVFGPIAWARKHFSIRAYTPLLFPIIVVFMLSIGRIYRVVEIVGFPLLDSQRVATRLIVLPTILTVVLAVLTFEKMMRIKAGRNIWLLVVAGLGLLAHDLWQHLKLWRVANMPGLFPAKDLDLSVNVVANHPDPLYEAALGFGAAITVITLVILVFLARMKPADANQSQPQVG